MSDPLSTPSPSLSKNRVDSDRQPKLEVCGVFQHFTHQGKPLTVLRDVNLHVYSNEFVSIVGPSGCGKTTLLHIVAGLTEASAGQVLMDGEAIEEPGCDRGMVFQNYTLFPWLTVADNVGFGLKLRGIPRAKRQEQVFHYLSVVGLTQFAQALPKQLSGGMKQRVAIARALANNPEVLLLDEPFGALDAQTREQMQQFFLELWQRTQITVLMITHDVEEAVFLSQRVYVMSARPGQVKDAVTIKLPTTRELEMKLSPSFLQIKRRIVNFLHDS